MATGTEHSGAMIALVPTDADLDRIAQPGGEPRDELHLTLYYLGDATDVDDQTRAAMTTAISQLAASRDEQPVRGRAFGVAHWNLTGDDPAWVLNVGDANEGESLGYVRSMCTEALYESSIDFTLPEQHTPWQPHICVAYSDDEDWYGRLLGLLGDVTFDRIRLAFGGEVTDVPLGPPATVASSAGGAIVPWHKVKGHTECPPGEPWAVVKDADGSVAGCHASEADADAQLAALYASEPSTSAVAVVDCPECDGGEEADAHFASTSVSDSPWNGAASRFTDEQYQRAAAACDPGDGTPKQRCFLPHHEPSGTLNRNGVHAAAARINQLKGHDPGAVARARGHLRRHYGQLGEDVPDVLKTEVEDDETFAARVVVGYVGEEGPEPVTADVSGIVTAAGKPPMKPADDPKSDCPDGHRMLSNGECVSEDEYAARAAWFGVLVVEGVTTGDGREFAPEALSWADNALVRWQKEGSHGGDHDVTVSVGRIDEVWRNGNQVMGRGMFDIESVDGFEIARRMKDNFAGGISIDADDIQDADVEFVWSEDADGPTSDDPLALLFGRPEKMIYHGGRVRAATICDIPAFVEARIQLGTLDDADATLLAAAAVGGISPAVVLAHQTPTTDDAWDANLERKLPNILPLTQARQAYAWVDEPVGERVAKLNCDLLHHEIRDGEVLGANLTACAAGIAALRASTYGAEDRAAIYAHLAGHLRDAGQEPPPLDTDAVTAAIVLNDWRPERAWFDDPQFSVHTGITVTDEGRVYGHAAPWNECHVGFQNECITMPREDSHPYFMTGEVVCADGSRVPVGQITVGTGHAPLSYRASHAAEHYDNTGAAVADVAVGNDRFGIWVAGAIRPSVAASRVHELRASGRLSGDWRRIGGQLRLVGLLAVNVPGFPLPAPRARIASGAPTALVAAGAGAALGPGLRTVELTDDDQDRLALRRVMSMLTSRVHRVPQHTEGA
jgi:hypothetical protein